MRFTRLIPALGAAPNLYSYYCNACGEAVTQVGGNRRDVTGFLSKGDRAAFSGSLKKKAPVWDTRGHEYGSGRL